MKRWISIIPLLVMSARAGAVITGNTVITADLLGYVLKTMSATVYLASPVSVTPAVDAVWTITTNGAPIPVTGTFVASSVTETGVVINRQTIDLSVTPAGNVVWNVQNIFPTWTVTGAVTTTGTVSNTPVWPTQTITGAVTVTGAVTNTPAYPTQTVTGSVTNTPVWPTQTVTGAVTANPPADATATDYQVSVNTAATSITGVACTNAKRLFIYNPGTEALYIGGSNTRTWTGQPIPAGGYMILDNIGGTANILYGVYPTITRLVQVGRN